MTNHTGEKARVERAPVKVYIGLGSNLGDREANLREARERIQAIGVNITRESSIYETEPVGYADQPWFLNQVIEATIAPEADFGAYQDAALFKAALEADSTVAAMRQSELLLSALLRIEREMGRVRNIPKGPRLIDIDLLLFGETITGRTIGQDIARAHPIIPHPRLGERRFVLEPLCEIAPCLTWPESDIRIADRLAALDDRAVVRIYKSDSGSA